MDDILKQMRVLAGIEEPRQEWSIPDFAQPAVGSPEPAEPTGIDVEQYQRLIGDAVNHGFDDWALPTTPISKE